MVLAITTWDERMARAGAKRQMVLDFLEDETWTTVEIVCRLLRCSLSTAHRTMQAAVRDKLIRSEVVGRFRIYGITGAGLAETEQFNMPEYEFGHVNVERIPHQLAVQLARLEAEALGWTEWMPARRMYRTGGDGSRKAMHSCGVKLPDALVRRPDGLRLAIEIERTPKSRRRYAGIIANHIAAFITGRYDGVHYLSPNGKSAALRRIFDSIETVRLDSEVITITDANRKRFRFFELEEWPNGGD